MSRRGAGRDGGFHGLWRYLRSVSDRVLLDAGAGPDLMGASPVRRGRRQ
jgi:hypothetical protein